MKKQQFIALLLAFVMCLGLCACGSASKETEAPSTTEKETEQETTLESTEESTEESKEEPKSVMNNGYININGICVDDSYRDKEESPLRTVFLFFTLTANDKNLSIDSTNMQLKINLNSYTSEYIPKLCKYTTNYYYSSYLQDVYVGDSVNVVATFKVPEGDLSAGKTITISDHQIPQVGDIYFTTDDIQHFNSNEEIMKTMDSEGYEEIMLLREEADEETTKKAKKLLNGYYWWFYVNNTYYEIEFYAPDEFEVRTNFGSNSGTYSVRNGYIFCTYPSNDATVEIPYTFENGEITLDCANAFDVMSN